MARCSSVSSKFTAANGSAADGGPTAPDPPRAGRNGAQLKFDFCLLVSTHSQPVSSAAAPLKAARQTAETRRADIVAAAAKEFAVNGLDGTSTEAIARRAGVSQPYLFRLFGTKKALFLATLERGSERIHQAFHQAAAEAIADGVDPFHAMGTRYRELLADRDGLLLQMHGYAACADDEVREQVRRRFGDLWTWLGTLPGGDPARVQSFLAMGMLLNVAAAMDLPAIVDKEEWAACTVAQPPAEETA